jgi:flagellar assembly factor FliW
MTFTTTHFGPISADESSAIEFPAGLPGFEECRRFIILQHPSEPALSFLQSLELSPLCFLAVPVRTIRPDYRLAIGEEDLELLGFKPDSRPEIGRDVLALAILSLVEGEAPSANLLSPVIIRMTTRSAVQAIRPDGRYTCREPLLLEEALCS